MDASTSVHSAMEGKRVDPKEPPDPSGDRGTYRLEKYQDMQRYFRRRLKATYGRYSDLPDLSVVHGCHHVYFTDGDSIYRMNKGQSEPEQVLDLQSVPGGEETTGREREDGCCQWTVQRIRLSPHEKHLAATLKSTRRKDLRCVVVRLEQKNPPLDPSPIVLTLDHVFSCEWATDDVLFYTPLVGLRCSRVHRLDLSSCGGTTTCVYEETQPDVFVEVALSRDRQILTINCSSRTSSEVLLVHAASPTLEPLLVQPRQPELLYHVTHWRNCLIILASTGRGQEYQVVRAPLSAPSMGLWETLFAPSPGTVIKDMDVVGDHCVLVVRTQAHELELIVIPLTQPETFRRVQTKSPGLADSHSQFEFLISSPVQPPVPYCLHLEEGLLLPGTDNTPPPKIQHSSLPTRLEASSQDGTLVPVTLFHTAPLGGLKQAPLLVHVYGAYGRDVSMDFCPDRRLLLEGGWALAYCHIRGGGERGLSWQRQARMEGKEKGVEDLRACLDHLFSLDVSSPALTALTACSAGAVPVGALCNRHPHMMQAVTLKAPFLDVLGTMEDPTLPLTLEDREEWGDPVGNPDHRLTIASYCPLRNITPQRYPSLLVTAYSRDDRVSLAGIQKYTEQLRSAVEMYFNRKPTSEHEPQPNILLRIQPGANHSGPEDVDSMLEEEALQLAFLYTELGLEPPRPPRKRAR
ncbi:prolyl endopeptidase-like [Lampetra planeri]